MADRAQGVVGRSEQYRWTHYSFGIHSDLPAAAWVMISYARVVSIGEDRINVGARHEGFGHRYNAA